MVVVKTFLLGEDYDEYGYVDYDDGHGPGASIWPRIMMKSTWARMPRIKRVEAPPRKLLVVPELNWALVK